MDLWRYLLRNCTSRLPLTHYFEAGELNSCKYIESRIDNCTASHSRCFTAEEMVQLKMDMIESFLYTIEVSCLKLPPLTPQINLPENLECDALVGLSRNKGLSNLQEKY